MPVHVPIIHLPPEIYNSLCRAAEQALGETFPKDASLAKQAEWIKSRLSGLWMEVQMYKAHREQCSKLGDYDAMTEKVPKLAFSSDGESINGKPPAEYTTVTIPEGYRSGVDEMKGMIRMGRDLLRKLGRYSLVDKLSDFDLTGPTLQTFFALIHESILEVPKFGLHSKCSNFMKSQLDQTLSLISELQFLPQGAKCSLRLLLKLITRLGKSAEDARIKSHFQRAQGVRVNPEMHWTAPITMAEIGDEITGQDPPLNYLKTQGEHCRDLWVDLDRGEYFQKIGELALVTAKQMWNESGRHLDFTATLRFLEAAPEATKTKEPDILSQSRPEGENLPHISITDYAPSPDSLKLLRLGRARHFMQDATAVHQTTTAQECLKQHLPHDVIDLILPYLKPKDYHLTRFKPWTTLRDNLDKIYKPWPENVSRYPGFEYLTLCGDGRCGYSEDKTSPYHGWSLACPAQSTDVWSIARREFQRLHQGYVCERGECDGHHEFSLVQAEKKEEAKEWEWSECVDKSGDLCMQEVLPLDALVKWHAEHPASSSSGI